MTDERPWYDTENGLRDALGRGLRGLNDIERARYEAGYSRKERLSEWVAGSFWLDRCGNAWTMETPVASPWAVVPFEDVRAQSGTSSLRPIASADATCPRCGRGWDLRTASDIESIGYNGPSMHRECKRYELQDRTEREIGEAASAAGLDPSTMVMVPNRYGSSDVYGPWFRVKSPIGTLTIGWRKRVIQIEWSGGPDGERLFGAEGVTVERGLVHAWGYENATAYLRRLVAAEAQP